MASATAAYRLTLLVLSMFAAAAWAAAPGDASQTGEPVVQAVRAQGSVTIDGRLNESDWALATPATEFTQLEPNEGEPASERTEVRILYDDEALYVGAVLHDRGELRKRLGRRDVLLTDSDWFAVSLDSYHDHITARTFRVNPLGVRNDEIVTLAVLPDTSWDPVWDAQATITESGWIAELRIPLSQLRYSRTSVQMMGIQLERKISRNEELSVLAFTPKSEFAGVSRYAHLIGVDGLQPRRRFEVLPYVVSRAEYLNSAAGSPLREERDYVTRAGMDLKYHFTSNLVLEATINPDFGQVELDPAVVNLTAYETFFEEKRPFFVAGAEFFQFGESTPLGGDQLLYSRRIGAPPGIWPADAVDVDLPEATTIAAAGKITGRTANGWSVGLLNATTAPENARYIDVLGSENTARVEPLTNYFAMRLSRDMRGGQSTIGGIVTAVNRNLSDEALGSQLRSEAYVAGMDFRHEWQNRAWALNGYLTGSYIAGEPGAIQAAQRSSARYYQRPDASHLSFDNSDTELSGYAARVELSRQAGRHWLGDLTVTAASPGYEINDLGFQSVVDRIETEAQLRYVENRPGTLFRNWSIAAGPGVSWNYGGDVLENGLTVRAKGQLLSYWSGSFSVGYGFPALDDRLTRGGPLARDPGGLTLSAGIQTDLRMPVTGTTLVTYNRNRAAGSSWSAQGIVVVQPASNWSLRLGASLGVDRGVQQYVRTINDPMAAHTFGSRYVFSDLDQTTVALEARLNIIFTPQLSLELYAQPLLSSGDFRNLKELDAARSFDFTRYGVEGGTLERDALGTYSIDPDGVGPAQTFQVTDPSYNLRSLRGIAVLRWEWRPGSTLFLVWQQRRARYQGIFDVGPEFSGFGRVDLERDIRELFRTKPDNTFLLKVNYWLNP